MKGWVPFLFLMEQNTIGREINSKSTFCKQLASWHYAGDWHFTTILAVTIESVRYLPDDVDELINELLLRFSEKPTSIELSEFLETNTRVQTWFLLSSQKPNVKSLNLDLVVPQRQPSH